MYADIVLPKNNEEEFIIIAQRLGYSALFLVYDYQNKKQVEILKEKFSALKHTTKFNLFLALKVKPTEIAKTRKFADLIFCESSEKNRWLVEKNRNFILYNLEYQQKNDFIHHRNSGLNHILCSFACENNVRIGISFSSLVHAHKKTKSVLIGRISQNIKLCRKYKVQLVLSSFANSVYDMKSPYDLQSFGVVLGMQPEEAKKAISYSKNNNL